MELTGSSTLRYRPWEQKDLLIRLQTFKPRSWYAKPAQISAVTCARHGWINCGPDSLKCEFCGECLDLPIRPRWSYQDVQKTTQEYAGCLVSAHTDSCPWRDTVCDAKLGQFPKLPARDVYVDFEQRYAHLEKVSHLPPLTEQAVDRIKEAVRDDMAVVLKRQKLRLAGMQAQSRLPAQNIDLEPLQALTDVSQRLAEQGSGAFVRRACLLAACGWDACKLSSLVTTNTSNASHHSIGALPPGSWDMQQLVLGCSMCGARAGLWSFAQQPGLEVDEEHRQPKDSDQVAAQAAPVSPVSRTNTGSAAADESTPARRNSIKRDLSRTIAGGPLVSPDNADNPGEPLHRPAFGSSSHTPNTAASTSQPFGSPLPHAPFGSPFPQQPEGSVIGSAMGSPPRHAPFGSPLQAPAFGSGSPSNSFANEAFFTPAATLNPRKQHAAPGSTTGVGDAAFDTPGSVYATPLSRFGTPSAGFGSPAFQTPANQLGHHPSSGLQPRGAPASVSRYDTPAAGTATPGLPVVRPSSGGAQAGTPGEGGAAPRPRGAPAFGGGAALPAFGMAVFKSPPPSRSPSAEKNQLAPLVAFPATATAVDLAATAVPGPSGGTADVAGLGMQPSGSKRKRDGGAGAAEMDMPSSSKQIRREGTAAEQSVGVQGPTGPTFHLLKSHKSFCPWVAAGTAEAGTSDPVCGWQWCLSSLAEHWDKEQDPSESMNSPLQGQSQRLRQALAAIGST